MLRSLLKRKAGMSCTLMVHAKATANPGVSLVSASGGGIMIQGIRVKYR